MTFLNLHGHYTLPIMLRMVSKPMNNQNEQNATCRVVLEDVHGGSIATNPCRFEIYQETETQTHEELLHVYFNQDEPLVSQTR